MSGTYLVQGNRNLKPPIQLPDWYQIIGLRKQQAVHKAKPSSIGQRRIFAKVCPKDMTKDGKKEDPRQDMTNIYVADKKML